MVSFTHLADTWTVESSFFGVRILLAHLADSMVTGWELKVVGYCLRILDDRRRVAYRDIMEKIHDIYR